MTDIMQGKHTINLLQAELFPVEPLWSLKKVVMVWVLVAVVMMCWVLFNQQKLTQINNNYTQLNDDKTALNKKLTELEGELEAHRPDNKLKEKIDSLALILNNKTRLHEELTDTTKTQVAGFAESMTELSENHHRGISLSLVQINNDDMTFVGITKTPQAVPVWLAGFETSTFLSGKQFINFVMQENEKKQTQFAVSSKAQLKEFIDE